MQLCLGNTCRGKGLTKMYARGISQKLLPTVTCTWHNLPHHSAQHLYILTLFQCFYMKISKFLNLLLLPAAVVKLQAAHSAHLFVRDHTLSTASCPPSSHPSTWHHQSFHIQLLPPGRHPPTAPMQLQQNRCSVAGQCPVQSGQKGPFLSTSRQ